MTRELDQYYSREKIAPITISKIVARLNLDRPPKISKRAEIERRMVDSKNTYELKVAHWKLEDITHAFWAKVRLIRLRG